MRRSRWRTCGFRPGTAAEVLKGDRSGQQGIRINQQWRICFTGVAPPGCEAGRVRPQRVLVASGARVACRHGTSGEFGTGSSVRRPHTPGGSTSPLRRCAGRRVPPARSRGRLDGVPPRRLARPRVPPTPTGRVRGSRAGVRSQPAGLLRVRSGRVAGPSSTAPSGVNREPWQRGSPRSARRRSTTRPRPGGGHRRTGDGCAHPACSLPLGTARRARLAPCPPRTLPPRLAPRPRTTHPGLDQPTTGHHRDRVAPPHNPNDELSQPG